MRLSHMLPTCFAVLLATSAASANLVAVPTGTIRHDRSDSSHTGLASLFPSVGMLNGGSGTLIGSDWVLTAAHVIAAGSPGANSFTIGGSTYVGAEIFLEPNWTPGDLHSGYDIALLRLATPVLNIAPAQYSGLTNEVGRIGTFVGFGATGTGLTGYTLSDGQKRAGQNVLDATADVFNVPGETPFSDRILVSDFDNPLDADDSFLGSPEPLDLEFNVAPGDSGGGLFVDFGFGDLLVGVHSFLLYDSSDPNDRPDADYGDGSGAIRTSSHVSFIQSTTGIAPAAVPEPNSAALSLLLAGATAGFRLNRRRRSRVPPDAPGRLG